MSYQDICKGLRKEAAFRKRALKGIGSLGGSRAFSKLTDIFRRLEPRGLTDRWYNYLQNVYQYPEKISRKTRKSILKGKDQFLRANAKHFDNPEKLSLLFRSSMRDPEKYEDAAKLVARMKGNPNMIKDLYHLNSPHDFGYVEELNKLLANIVKL